MKINFELRFKKPGVKPKSDVFLGTEKADLVFVESEISVEMDGKTYSGYRLLALLEDPKP